MKTIKILSSLFLSIALCFMLGSFIANAAEIPQYGLHIGSGLVLAGALIQAPQGVLLMATPDTSALAAYAGKFEKALFSTLRLKLTMLNDLTVLPGIKSKLKLTKLTVKDGVRGYREAFDDADDDLAYSGRDAETELLKRDIKINPLKYRTTHMSEVMKPGVNPDDIPFAPFVNESIMKQIASEVQRGSYLAVKGDYSTLLTSFNGLGTIIANEIIATNLTPIATGALTNLNAVAKFEQMVAAMPVQFVDEGFEIKASVDSVRKYQEDYRERYGKYKEKNEKGMLEVEDVAGKVTIKPCTWMGTSGRLIATPFENALACIDGLGDMDKIITDLELEIIKYRILFALGFQFRDLGALRVNDQA
jgi:hypothetical protein